MLAIGGVSTGGSGGPAYTDEQARDALGTALVAGPNVTIAVDDAADTITISASVPAGYSDEQAQDAFAALVAAGTHAGISFVYNDAGNAISATVSAQSWSQITGKPTFATVATSGSYTDLADKPAITPPTRAITAGTGLTGGGDLTADRSLAVAYGTTTGTAAQGNDARLSDTRTPTDSSVTDAKVASGAAIAENKLALASDAAAGTASRRTLGTGATQAAAGNDGRLSDARTPTAHTHGVTDLTATGTKDSTTFLRGDNTFAVPPGGTGLTPTATKTGAYTANNGELVMVNATGGAVTITAPATAPSRAFAVKKLDSSVNAVTVVRAGTDTIGSDAATSIPIKTNDQATHFLANGSNWVVPYNHLSLAALDSRFAATGQHHPTGIHVGSPVDDSVWYPGFTTGGIHGSGGLLEELVSGTSASPDTTDTATSWIQKFTALNQDIRYHYVSGALVETVKTGGNSAPNSLVASITATGGKGDMTGLQGRAVADVDLGTSTGESISTGVWAASVTPTAAAAYTSSCGLEINVFNRFGSTTKKQYLTPGTLVGALIYNYSANPSSGAADGTARPNHFAVYIGGNTASSYHTGILLDGIINDGIRFEGSAKPAAGKTGIVFNDAYQSTGIKFTAAMSNDAGTANEGVGIDLGNNRLRFADFNGSAWSVGDLWKYGDSLYYRVPNGGTPLNGEMVISRGVSTVAATSGTRKIAVLISGTTYYLLATP